MTMDISYLLFNIDMKINEIGYRIEGYLLKFQTESIVSNVR